jgi:hypothetical protein
LEHLIRQKRWLSARLGFDMLVPRYSTSAGHIETKFLQSYLELLEVIFVTCADNDFNLRLKIEGCGLKVLFACPSPG